MAYEFNKQLHNERSKKAMQKHRANGGSERVKTNYKHLRDLGFHYTVANRIKYWSNERIDKITKDHINLTLDELNEITSV